MQEPWRKPAMREIVRSRAAARSRSTWRGVIALLAAAGCAGVAGVATAADGKAQFEANCGACHSIGGGPRMGPDLKVSLEKRGKDWMVTAVMNPSGAGLAPSMPNLGVTKPDAEAIVDHIARVAGGAGGGEKTAAPAAPSGDAARGKALFSGTSALQSGAVSCIGCHNAGGVGALGGGNLASDLSDAGLRYTQGEGLVPLLTDMPIPAMKAIYGPRPLTQSEAADLAAFLGAQTAKDPHSHTLEFLGLGIAGTLLLAGLSQLIWRKRFKGVRQQLTEGR